MGQEGHEGYRRCGGSPSEPPDKLSKDTNVGTTPRMETAGHTAPTLCFVVFKIFLFAWLRQVLAVARGIFDLHCGKQDL